MIDMNVFRQAFAQGVARAEVSKVLVDFACGVTLESNQKLRVSLLADDDKGGTVIVSNDMDGLRVNVRQGAMSVTSDPPTDPNVPTLVVCRYAFGEWGYPVTLCEHGAEEERCADGAALACALSRRLAHPNVGHVLANMMRTSKAPAEPPTAHA